MKRQKVLFLKENYVLRVLKSFMVAGLFVIALLLILVHKIDLGLISGVSKGVFFISAPLIHTAVLPAEGLSYAYKKTAEIISVYEENERLREENGELFLLKDRMKQVLPEQTEGIAEQLGNLRKEIFSLFPDLSTKRAAVFTELAELALDQEKTLKEDQIRQIILKYRNQE